MQIQFKLAAFGAALLLAANACVTVSCGKDENEQPKERVVAKLKTEALAGTYVVSQRFSIKMFGQEAVLGQLKEHNLKMVPATDSTVDITTDAYDINLVEGAPYSSAAQKSYTLKGVKVVKTGEKDFVLSGKVKADAEIQLVPLKQKKEEMPYRVFPATEYNVAGTVKDGVLELEYSLQPGKMPFPLTFTCSTANEHKGKLRWFLSVVSSFVDERCMALPTDRQQQTSLARSGRLLLPFVCAK